MILQASVYLMVIGALIASGDDLTFNWFGYTFLSMNNLFTAAQGVVIKQKLDNKVKRGDRIRLLMPRLIPGFESKRSFILQFITDSRPNPSLSFLHRRLE